MVATNPINIRLSDDTRSTLKELTRTYPLSRHAIASRALDLGLSVLINDRKWLTEGGDGRTDSYVEREYASPTEHSYLIHDNGGRPWRVVASRKSVRVFNRYRRGMPDQSMFVHGRGALVPGKLVHRSPEYLGFWYGFDTSGCFAHGNTILAKLSDHRYLHVQRHVVEFDTDDVITEYVSRLGNSDVPYPVAFSKEYVYFLTGPTHMYRTAKADLKTRATLWNAHELYTESYGQDGFKKPPRERLKVRIIRKGII